METWNERTPQELWDMADDDSKFEYLRSIGKQGDVGGVGARLEDHEISGMVDEKEFEKVRERINKKVEFERAQTEKNRAHFKKTAEKRKERLAQGRRSVLTDVMNQQNPEMDVKEEVKSTSKYRVRKRYRKPYTPPYPAMPQFGGLFKWKMSPAFYAETRLTDFTKKLPSGPLAKYQSMMWRSFSNCSRLLKYAARDYLIVKAKMKYDWLKIMKIRKPMMRLAYRLFPRAKADEIKKKFTSILGGKVLQRKTFRKGYRYRKKRRFS